MADIDFGQLSEALNDKMDRDGNNIESPRLPIFLVAKQDPTADNNYTWYRKWSDGWVEQGGGNVPSSATYVTFPIVMADTNYTLVGGELSSSNDTTWHSHASVGYSRTTTGFSTRSVATKCWVVCGMAAN